MKVYNPQDQMTLHPDIVSLLDSLRSERGFDSERFLIEKSNLLNDYLRRYGLSSCVVAVSGGIDSSLVLALVARAASRYGSPIKRIIPVMLPVFSDNGATGQEEATARALEVCHSLSLEANVIDLTAAQREIKRAVDSVLQVEGEAWADGQLVAYTRTPALYYVTSLLSQEGTPGVICGTTNRDEGAYLGYIGKASDGMVDLQLIADLHKSEVYRVARALNLPKSVIDVTPTGDMFDGRPDEEVFGAPYDFVETYLLYLSHPEKETLLDSLPFEACEQFDTLAERLEKLHTYNLHKYLGQSPAVHLNVYPSAVPGGWLR
jgi:NAD+ synthetase